VAKRDDPFAEVAPHFTPEVLARSRELLGRGRIELTTLEPGRAVASVQGSRRRPYRTEVAFERDADGKLVTLRGWCGCPVGHRCKHVAAVALMIAEREGGGPTTVAARNREAMLRWAEGQVVRDGAANVPHAQRRSRRELRFILDGDDAGGSPPVIHTVSVSPSAKGPVRERAVDLDTKPKLIPRWIGIDDRLLYLELRARERDSYGYGHLAPRLPPDETGPKILEQLVKTGRTHLARVGSPALRWTKGKRAEVGWQLDHRGTQRPALLGLPKGAVILALRPPHFIDPATGACGPVLTELSPAAAQAVLRAPELTAEAADGLPQGAWPEASGVPPPRRLRVVTRDGASLRPVLSLDGNGRKGWAELSFRYGEAICDPDEPHDEASIVSAATTVVRIRRDRAAESEYAARLAALGLSTHEAADADSEGRWRSRWTFADARTTEDAEEAWLDFSADAVPSLAADGWLVEREPGFAWTLAAVDGWYAEIEAEEDGEWFALSVGVEVDGARVGLLPAIKRALASGRMGPDVPARGVLLELPDGRRVRLPPERLKTILAVLLELFEGRPFDASGRLRLPRAAASRLVELDPRQDLRWYGPVKLRRLGESLQEAAGGQIPDVATPAACRATLRRYQSEGLAWLQFLRTYALGGVLADDMGLGKTVQTLAHLLVEQQAGRLDRPCLVVAPTSVLPVWRDEAERFAPSLSVLVHHGPRRGKTPDALQEHDVILTTYAVMLRDVELLAEVPLHLAVLDEAQAIKNPSAKVSRAARRLVARSRLALTGTPLENDLSELWSLVDFVMPGLLGTAHRFSRVFAHPIEDGDESRRAALVSRLGPFMLRRTKGDVLPELPPKIEQIRYAELPAPQRDLYESVRMGVLSDVRKLIEKKGLARSQIGVLEALLKLREVCCDPRLLPYASAKKVKRSAKLELLTSLVPELVAAGRRIVVFSQFTRMLELIGTALDEVDVGWVRLTGRTRKRDAVVAQFNAGQVPVFLVSLKAGGTGLNLTTADTVIHYDPWWNPAAVDQATDRAHRIGQTRSVLALSLVARGTVEERMVELQRRKRAIADGILSAAADRAKQGKSGLTEDELSALLAPVGRE